MTLRRFARWLAVVACGASAGALMACRKSTPPESRGRAVDTGTTEARVASLSPAVTEIVFAIGASSALVGRTRYCTHPAAAAAVPVLGGFSDVSLEAVLAARPTVVYAGVGPSTERLRGQLVDRGIATRLISDESFDAILRAVAAVGADVARESGARELVESLRTDLTALDRELANTARARTVMLVSEKPLVAVGQRTFLDEMLRHAGATNAVDGAGYVTLGLEELVALEPAIVVIASASGMDDSHSSDTLVSRMKRTRFLHVRDDRIVRPGPRFVQGTRCLAAAMHPQANDVARDLACE